MVRERPLQEFSHHPTLAEARTIRELKGEADAEGRARWTPHEGGGSRDAAGLAAVSSMLETDFVGKVAELSRRFPRQRIEVLFEGAGASRFPEELTERCKKRGLKVRVFRSDLYSPYVFREIAAGRKLNPRNYRSAAPEELVQVFGKRRFHLVVSRSGGINYTPFSQVKGIHNVCRVLKPGGEAHIFTEEVDKPPLPIGREVRLTDWRGRVTPVGEFFAKHSQFEATSDEHIGGTPFVRRFPIIRIKRRV